MSAEKKLYNFQQILPFNLGPVFPELAGKTVGELTDEQAVQAHEDWIRAQFGHMTEYYRPHLAMLLHVIDGLRAPRKACFAHNLMKEGGDWLGSARSYLQSHVKNGEHVRWGSGDLVTMTVQQYEEAASHIAAAAINSDRKRRT